MNCTVSTPEVAPTRSVSVRVPRYPLVTVSTAPACSPTAAGTRKTAEATHLRARSGDSLQVHAHAVLSRLLANLTHLQRRGRVGHDVAIGARVDARGREGRAVGRFRPARSVQRSGCSPSRCVGPGTAGVCRRCTHYSDVVRSRNYASGWTGNERGHARQCRQGTVSFAPPTTLVQAPVARTPAVVVGNVVALVVPRDRPMLPLYASELPGAPVTAGVTPTVKFTSLIVASATRRRAGSRSWARSPAH